MHVGRGCEWASEALHREEGRDVYVGGASGSQSGYIQVRVRVNPYVTGQLRHLPFWAIRVLITGRRA